MFTGMSSLCVPPLGSALRALNYPRRTHLVSPSGLQRQLVVRAGNDHLHGEFMAASKKAAEHDHVQTLNEHAEAEESFSLPVGAMVAPTILPALRMYELALTEAPLSTKVYKRLYQMVLGGADEAKNIAALQALEVEEVSLRPLAIAAPAAVRDLAVAQSREKADVRLAGSASIAATALFHALQRGLLLGENPELEEELMIMERWAEILSRIALLKEKMKMESG